VGEKVRISNGGNTRHRRQVGTGAELDPCGNTGGFVSPDVVETSDEVDHWQGCFVESLAECEATEESVCYMGGGFGSHTLDPGDRWGVVT
jgi:hypothetical protein